MSALSGRRSRGGLAAALAAAAVLVAGCGGGEREPDLGTATLAPIPANALVVLHLSTDTRRGPVRVAGKVARRLPSWAGLQRPSPRALPRVGVEEDLQLGVPRDDGASLVMRRIADSDVRVPVFRSTLQDVAPADTLTYVASGDLGPALERFLLLAEPGGSAPAPAVSRFTALSRLGRESGTIVAPGQQGPVITLLSRVAEPDRVRAAMAGLEADLATLVGAPGTATWIDATPGGLRGRTLADAPGRGFSWAIDGSTLIVSTALDGIGTIKADGPRLGGTRAFRAVTGNTRNPITSLVFLDPNQLLRLGADTGLGPAGALEGSRRDLAKVRAIGVTTTGSSRESTVDLSLWIP